MQKFKKDEESKAEYIKYREVRIREVCKLAGVNFDDYIQALSISNSSYKIVLARDLDETNINPFNIEWLRAWNGNMDLQPVLDFFAVVTYVTDYYAKDDTGIMDILKNVLKDDNSDNIKDRMKTLANAFLMMRQIGEAEAVYRLIPRMTLSKSNIKCKFVATGPKEERSTFCRRATEKQLEAGIQTVKLANQDGDFYEQPDIWDKYLRRPQELKEICFAQFAKIYDSKAREVSNEDEDQEDDCMVGVQDEDEPESDNKFHYIMTFQNNGSKGTLLPKMIELQNPQSHEARYMVRRSFPAALRFHMVKKQNDHSRFMLNELMLYRPLDHEIEPDEIESFYFEKIQVVKSQVMEYHEGVEEARYHVEQIKKELEIDLNAEVGSKLDPMGLQDNENCAEDLEDDNENFEHCNPDYIDIDESKPNKESAKSLLRKIDLPTARELKEKIRLLDPYQREVLNIATKYAKDIVKSRNPKNRYPPGPLVMVGGGAGAGKSTVINVITEVVQSIVQKEGDNQEQSSSQPSLGVLLPTLRLTHCMELLVSVGEISTSPSLTRKEMKKELQ